MLNKVELKNLVRHKKSVAKLMRFNGLSFNEIQVYFKNDKLFSLVTK